LAADIGMAISDAHLDFPVYLTLPKPGDSVATMACPIDPSDADWSNASAIVCDIIGKRLGDACSATGSELEGIVQGAEVADQGDTGDGGGVGGFEAIVTSRC
jgi:hypothetical protein